MSLLQSSNTSRRIFKLLLALSSFLIVVSFVIIYHAQTTAQMDQLKRRELFSMQLEQSAISDFFTNIATDLLFLARTSSMRSYLDGKGSLQTVTEDLVTFSESSLLYDQVRLLDRSGMEVSRVDLKNQTPTVIPREQLQNKAARYYFPNTLKLGPKEIFISPLDLNIEHGKVEIPFKPMLRFGTPVFDSHNTKQGVVILNYLAQTMLDKLERVSVSSTGETSLLNPNGYWLYAPQPEKEWGFMLTERAGISFGRSYPEAWAIIQHRTKGQIITSSGLFTFARMSPLTNHTSITPVSIAAAPQLYWILVSHIPKTTITGIYQKTAFRLALLAAVFILLSGFGSWSLSLILAHRQQRQQQLVHQANRDPLTLLANRALFMEQLEASYEQAQLYSKQIALLFVDLDDFKAVNDTQGHAAGDNLLCQVADRLQQTCRQSDTVARLGGDEFAIILPEIQNCMDAETVAAKALQILSMPFNLDGTETRISASIGICTFPDCCSSIKEMMDKADAAMYVAKQNGKHQYAVAPIPAQTKPEHTTAPLPKPQTETQANSQGNSQTDSLPDAQDQTEQNNTTASE